MGDIKLGSRVLYNFKYKGTVMFIGETILAKGLLYGVELDTPDGKMNGTMNGKFYFPCKENYGIFVRRSQLSEILDENIESKNDPIVVSHEPQAKQIQNTQLNEIVDSNLLTEKPCLETEKKRNTLAPRTSTNNEKENQYILPITSNLPRPNPTFNARRSTMVPSAIPEPKKPPPNNITLIDQKSQEIKDLKEKLETIKNLKRKDREELLESGRLIEKLRQEIVSLTEQTDRLSQDKLKVVQEFATYKDSMQTVEEDIEMMTIEKEMAEEKLEQAYSDYEGLKVRYDKAVQENEMLKSDSDSSIAKQFLDQSGTLVQYEKAILEMSHSVKALQAKLESQNSELEILRELQCFQETEIIHLRTTNEKGASDLRTMQDLVDSTADMELIVDKLTFENEALEQQHEGMMRQILQMEANDSKSASHLENARQEIHKLREEIECMSTVISALEDRARDHRSEQETSTTTLATAHATIVSLQREMSALREEAQSNSAMISKWREDSRRLSVLDYSRQTNARRDLIRDIQDKLITIDIEDKSHRIRLLYQFLPSVFVVNSLDNDMIGLVLLIERLNQKVTLLIDHIKTLGQKRRGANSAKKCEKLSTCLKLEFLLENWRALLGQLSISVDRCGPDKLQLIVKQARALIGHEKTADSLIDLCKKECIDVGRDLGIVIDTISTFSRFYVDHFQADFLGADCESHMTGFIAVIYRGTTCLLHDAAWIEHSMIAKNHRNPQFQVLIDKMRTLSSNIESTMKSTLLFLKSTQPIQFEAATSKLMHETVSNLLSLVETVSRLGLQYDEDKISGIDLVQKLCCDMFQQQHHLGNRTSVGNIDVVKALESVEQISVGIAADLQKGLFDTTKPVVQCDKSMDLWTSAYRARMQKLQNLPNEVDLKSERIRALGHELKMQIDRTAESNLKVQYLTKKIDDVNTIKDKEISALREQLQSINTAPICNDHDRVHGNTEKKEEIDRLNEESDRVCDKCATSLIDDVIDSVNNVDNTDHIHDNKEGDQNTDIRELALACAHLNQVAMTARANKSRTTLSALRPLPLANRHRQAPHASMATEQCMLDRARLLSEQVYRDLSGTRVLDLSAGTGTRSMIEQARRRAGIRKHFLKLQHDFGAIALGEPCTGTGTGTGTGTDGTIIDHQYRDGTTASTMVMVPPALHALLVNK